jgi:hypothetical protein
MDVRIDNHIRNMADFSGFEARSPCKPPTIVDAILSPCQNLLREAPDNTDSLELSPLYRYFKRDNVVSTILRSVWRLILTKLLRIQAHLLTESQDGGHGRVVCVHGHVCGGRSHDDMDG